MTSRCNASCRQCLRNFFGKPFESLPLTDLTFDDIKRMFPEEFVRPLKLILFMSGTYAHRSRLARAGLAAGLALVAHLMLNSAGAASAAVDSSQASACEETTITAFSEADAWVAENNTSSTGSDSILMVEANPSSGNSRALVRFRLPSVVPPGCIVESARLRLNTAAGSEGARVEAVRLGSAWSEGSVIWSDQPETTGPAAAATNQPATAGTAATTSSGNGYREWNVVGQVQSMYDTGASHGFLIRDATENQDAEQSFHSREKGANLPQLVIRFGLAGG